MKKGTIRLWLRIDKPNKGGTNRAIAGTVPIFIIYSKSGNRQYLNSGINIFPEQFTDDQKIKVLGKESAKRYGLKIIDIATLTDAKEQMQEIDRLKTLIHDTEKEFEVKKQPFTSLDVMNEVKKRLKPTEKKEDTHNEVLAFMRDWIAKNELTTKKGSMQVYRTVAKRLFEYERAKKMKLTFDATKHSFFEDFKIFLESEYNLNSITIAKQLSTLKTFLNKAATNDEIPVNRNYKQYKIKRDTDLEVIALTENEFDTLWELDLGSNKRLDAIRDVFIFSCVTGMRYSDLAQLRHYQITDENIHQTVTKTSSKIKIPLNKYSRSILEKYKDLPLPLPIISNQKSNKALHDLCEYAGINEPLEIVRKVKNQYVKTLYPKYDLVTMHSGRKTFATLSLKKGMAIQYVMKIGGWEDYKSFERYVKVTDDHAKEAMADVWDKEKKQ